jgi:D-3-phosphoglycerate dehydrogenase
MSETGALGRVVVAEPFDERGLDVLRRAGAEVVSVVGAPRSALSDALRDARGLIVRSETRVDKDLLSIAPRLEVVARAGVGVDAIDVEAATAAGIIVVNTPGANTLAATEQTFALLLAAMRNVPQAHASVHAGEWDRKPFIGHELYGKRLGIIGLGRIGSNVATRAIAFGMCVVAYDPYIPASRARALGVDLVDFEELMRGSEIVTLHVPLTAQTRKIIDAGALALMRDDAVLVNCARGAVVDADALLETLEHGRLRAVAVDVVPQEPPPPGSASARLLMHPRVVATPHLGGSTYEALERIALEIAGDVARVLGGRPAFGAVNAPILSGADAERAGGFVDLAYRLGATLPQLFDEALRHEIALVLQGEIESLDAEPFIAALLAGALPFVTDQRVTLVNAVALARDLGVRTAFSHEPSSAPFRSRILVAAGEHRIAGTVLPHGPRIVEIDGLEIDAVAEGTLLVTRHRDIPGMVGRIGTILGESHCNISTMQVARTSQGGDAMMFLGIDRDIERADLERIARAEGIASARVVRL